MNILILMDMPLFPYRIYAYNELADRGYKITVVSMSDQDVSYDIPMKFDHIRMSYKTIVGMRFVRGFSSLKYDNYEIIIVAPNFRMLNYYALYNKKYWDKLIAWGHHKGCTTANPIASLIRKPFLRKFAAILFYDYVTRDEFLEEGFIPEKLYVANNTQYVDLSTVKIDEEKKYFLYVGRIQERKAIDIAIKAFAELRKRNNDVLFKVVGGGNAKDLKSLCDELNVSEFVEFVGPIHGEKELSDIFNHAIAYVSPGHVGLGVLHSFAFGVPVITCSGRLHSVEISNCKKENSLVVPFSYQAVAQAMESLCKNDSLRREMSYDAHNYYLRYCTIDKMVDGIEDSIKYLNSMHNN